MDQFDEDTLKEFKEAFNFFDRNGDGLIEAKDICIVMQSLGRSPTDDEVQDIIERVDLEKIGKLDFNGFVAAMVIDMDPKAREEKVKAAFKVFDFDGDGLVSVKELRHILTNVGERLTDAEVDQLLAKTNVGPDDQINYEQFAELMLHK